MPRREVGGDRRRHAMPHGQRPLRFQVNADLLAEARARLGSQRRLSWLLGGSGAGKSAVCQALAARYRLPVYDLDARIYGSYHGRFTPERHPVNRVWSAAADGLAWLLDLSWEEFDQFHRAALPEYLDLLAEDLEHANLEPDAPVLVDGGVWHPALLARVIPPRQIVCLQGPDQSERVWDAAGERQAMKAAIGQLPQPAVAWRTFLEYDQRITQTILVECRAHGISVCMRGATESADAVAQRVAEALGLS